MEKEVNFFKISIFMYVFAELVFSFSAIGEILGDLNSKCGQLLKHIAIVFILMGIVQKYKDYIKVKYLVISMLLLSLSYYIEYSINRGTNFLMLILIIIGIGNSDVDEYVTSFIKIFQLTPLLIFISHFFGLLNGTYGFAHKNTFGMIAFIVVIMQLFKNKFQINIIQFLIYGVIFYFTYNVVMSRSASYLILIAIIIAILNTILKTEKSKKILSIILLGICLIIVGIFIYSVCMYSDNPDKYKVIDDLFSNRLYMCSRFLETYDIQLFGRYLAHYGSASYSGEYLYLDSSYINIILSYGLIFTVIFFIAYFRIIYFSIKNGNFPVVFCLSLYLLYGCSELTLYSFVSNFALLYYAQLIGMKKIMPIKQGEVI